MSEKRANYILVLLLSLLTSAGILAQMFMVLKTGEAYCLNQGCRIVETLTRPTPLVFNAIGLLYFLFTALLATGAIYFHRHGAKGLASQLDIWLRVVLLSGLSSEAVFISYQIFVAHTMCSYCIGIFSSLFLLNILLGKRQFTMGTAIVVAGVVASSLLRYDPDIFLAKKDLDQGTYAIKTCTEPLRRLYLIFSKDCPHCKKVLEVLKGCSQCEFHFNPIEKIDEILLPGLVPESSYDPNINIATLKILGINEIPVLIDKGERGMLFIKGDQDIINYIEKHCFQPFPSLEEGLHQEFQGEDGVCSLELEKECK